MSDTLHIVCLDAPSPPDYGGVFDLYYKIPALASAGKRITLHYFDYKQNRGAEGLEPYCAAIYRYKRSSFLNALLSLKSYIVSSRTNAKLIARLNADASPVLIEGIHCSGIIPYLKKEKKIIIRLHNNEAEYYKNLRKTETNLFKKIYFGYEENRLSAYQKRLQTDTSFACVSTTDLETFKQLYQQTNAVFIPCFLPWQKISSKTGMGTYCLYHGNLSVPENIQAAEWLVNHVFAKLNYPLTIAGKNASLLQNKKGFSNVTLVNNPSDDELSELIREAHINVLPSLNNTGVKLKLLHALFEGRFCITNESGIKGSGLSNGIHIANESESVINCIEKLTQKEFTEAEKQNRNELLQLYNNHLNAQKLNALL